MKSSSGTIAKNISVMMTAQLLTWGMTLLLTIFLPRTLGPATIGYFYLAWAIWTIVTVVATFGTDTYLTKSIARDAATLPHLLGSVILLRIVFYLICWIFVIAYVHVIEYPQEVVAIIYIIGVVVLFDLLGHSVGSSLHGLELMEYNSITTIVGKLIYTTLTLGLLFAGASIYFIASVSVLTSVITLILSSYFLHRRYSFQLQFNVRHLTSLIRSGAPYLVISLTLTVYHQIDAIIIASLTTETAVGWYTSAVNLYGTLMFFPMVFMAAIFPPLTRAYASTPDLASKLTRKSFDLMFIAGVPISLGLFVVGDQLVHLLLGPAFEPSSVILRTLAFVLVFTYLNIVFGQTMISIDKTHVWTIVMIIATVATIILDIILVPLCDRLFGNPALGGALSYLAVEAVMTMAAILMLPKGTMNWANVRCAVLSLLAGLIMLAACWPARDLFLPIPIVIGVLVYPTLVLLFRIISPEDIALFRSLLSQVLAHIPLRVRTPASVGGGQ